MPFVQRVITPKYIARSQYQHQKLRHQQQQANGDINGNGECSSGPSSGLGLSAGGGNDVNISSGGVIEDYELESITNLTLSNALRQLASLTILSNQIFTELNRELQEVGERSRGLNTRIEKIREQVDAFDPKLVTVRKYLLIYLFTLSYLLINLSVSMYIYLYRQSMSSLPPPHQFSTRITSLVLTALHAAEVQLNNSLPLIGNQGIHSEMFPILII